MQEHSKLQGRYEQILLDGGSVADFLTVPLQITFATLVPPIVILLAKHPVVSNYDLSSLRWISSGAAPLSAEVERQILDRLNVKTRQTWGGTEQTCCGTFMRAWEPIAQGSVGRPLPGMKLMVVNPDTENEVGVEEEGELWMAGPNIMRGYHSNPSATQSSLVERNGQTWYRTGDSGLWRANGAESHTEESLTVFWFSRNTVGKVDANGIVTITDRLKGRFASFWLR